MSHNMVWETVSPNGIGVAGFGGRWRIDAWPAVDIDDNVFATLAEVTPPPAEVQAGVPPELCGYSIFALGMEGAGYTLPTWRAGDEYDPKETFSFIRPSGTRSPSGRQQPHLAPGPPRPRVALDSLGRCSAWWQR